jgi:hypothetical protein
MASEGVVDFRALQYIRAMPRQRRQAGRIPRNGDHQ